jgi:aspartate-semialdehyde dehydrogenase
VSLVSSNQQISEEQLKRIVDECFKQIDTNHDGKLSYEEFKAAIESQKLLINCFVHYPTTTPPPTITVSTTATSAPASTSASASAVVSTKMNSAATALAPSSASSTSTTVVSDQETPLQSQQPNIPTLNLAPSTISHFEDPNTPNLDY